VTPYPVWQTFTDVLKEYATSIFRVEGYTERGEKYHGVKAYSSVLKMGAARPSESLVNLYQTTRRHIPEDFY
jgi:hypothetical protein